MKLKMSQKIPFSLRFALAAWTSMIVMMGVAVGIYDVRFSGSDSGMIIVAIGIASLTVGLNVGCCCYSMSLTNKE